MLEYVYQQIRDFLETVRSETREQGLLPLLEPVAPYNQSPLFLPLVVAGSLLSLLLLSGLAIGAFAMLFAALLGLYLLLTEVFGVSLEIEPLGR
jgi:hypothetical protein